jgi:Fibronectin type III domain
VGKIKLNLRSLPIPEKVAKARTIITSLTGNADFPTPNPTLLAITAVTDDLEAAAATVQDEKQQLKTSVSKQNEKEDLFDAAFSKLVGYVQSVAGDDEAMIHSAGMDTKAAGGPSTSTPALPPALSATAGDHDGEIDLTWDTVPKAKSYVIEKSGDPPTATSWQHAGVSTKSSTTIDGLTPGTRYWFRVAAVGTAGQSGWSDPASKIAP